MRDVLSGEIPACAYVTAAARRQQADLAAHKSRSSVYVFDVNAAERVCMAVEQFSHVKGIWARAATSIVLEPWQKFILTTVFGWKVRETGMRRFRTVYIEVPRKNAKSTISSTVGLYLLACDGEAGALIVSAANTREQAKIIFNDAQLMARRETGFQRRFGVSVHAHAISVEQSASRFMAISAEDSNLDGLNIHGALIDELHAHKTRGVWDVLETATGSRSQPLIWAITTAGVNRASVCFEQRRHVIDVLNGLVSDESYFGIIYTIDDGDDPFSEAAWMKANPNYGVSIYPEHMKAMAARAQSMPSMQTAFLTKHLDVWVNADHSWLDIRAWQKCADESMSIMDFEGQLCFVGLDLAIRSDIAAVMLLFPPAGQRAHWAVFGRYYLCEETIEKAENAHYQGWESSGLLISTPGSVTDVNFIIHDLVDYCSRFNVHEVASDPYKNLPVVSALQNLGVTIPVVDLRQSKAVMSPAMKELEAMVMSQKLRHDGDPVLSWMVSNVVCQRDEQDNIYPRKDSPERKIDGVLALLMALDRALKALPPDTSPTPGLWII